MEYSVDFGEGDQRTMAVRELVAAYNSGQITGETYVWAEGFADWKPLSDVPELVSALNAAASPPAAAAPSPWDQKPKATASIPRAAARATGRSASPDLFGRIEAAGSEDDVATSAPDPLGTPSSTGSGTGSRNESSVLFSLSALTSAAQSRPSNRPGANGSASRDDSGLIDLKALTAAAMKTDTTGGPPAVAPALAQMAPMAPLGVASPLGFGSPLGSYAASADIGMPQPRSKAPLIIGGGLAVGLIAIALAIVLKPNPPPPPPPVIVAAPPPPAPTPTPTPQEVAKPPATGTGEEASPESTTKTVAKSRPRQVSGSARKSSGATPSGGDAKAKPSAPAPKRNACGCASGDLQCAMRCAAKGG
jgi:hypothetical protein